MFDTMRWTSKEYDITFHRITQESPIESPDGMTLTAWGISNNLQSFLVDYSIETVNRVVRSYLPYVIDTVVGIIAELLERTERQGDAIPPLESLYLVVQADLIMPDRSVFPVDFITNIVKQPNPLKVMKFIAVVDPSESGVYIDERTAQLPNNDWLQ